MKLDKAAIYVLGGLAAAFVVLALVTKNVLSLVNLFIGIVIGLLISKRSTSF